MLHDVLSTGSIALDVALDVGGFARGHLVEVFGDETTGKSTLGLLTARAAQRAGDEAAFIDAEHTFDASYARALGISMDHLVVSQPESGEAAFGVARTFLRTGAVAAVVIDSAAALTPGGRSGAVDMSLRRRLIDRGVRELLTLAAEKHAVVVIVNRPSMRRDHATSSWVESSAAGDVLPELASMRVRLTRIGGDSTATRVRAVVVKNTLRPQQDGPRCTDLLWRWGAGVDRSSDLLVAAFDLKVIGAAAGRFYFDGACIGALEVAREALLGPLGARVEAAIIAAAPWRAPAPLPAEEAASA